MIFVFISFVCAVAAWLQNNLILQIFPLHETSALTSLQSNWVRKLFSIQPLDDIAEYFGVKVAFYFAWLGHYTCALGVPAIFGVILWASLYDRSQVAQDIGHVIFSLFNVVWASLYLEAWRRYSVQLAFQWGTLSTPPELLEPPRPLYKVNIAAFTKKSKIIRRTFITTLIDNKNYISLTGKTDGKFSHRQFGARRNTSMATLGIPISSQLSNYWALFTVSFYRYVCHATATGNPKNFIFVGKFASNKVLVIYH